MTGLIIQPSSGGSGDLLSTNNLSDVASAATSRTNLGLGTMATQNASAVTLTGLLTITQASANAGIIASTGYSLTGSGAASMIDISGTLNTTGSPDVFALRITDTARGANTKLVNIYAGAAGATSVFSISRLGSILVPSSGTSGYYCGTTNCGMLSDSFTQLQFVVNSNQLAQVDYSSLYGGFSIRSASYLEWKSGALSAAVGDLRLFRDAAATLAQRDGTNAQTLRIYGTYTDASNYVRAAINTTSTTVALACETAGTGADDIDLTLTPAGAGVVKFGTHSALAAETVSGYITIKDSGGTERKLAVVS